MNINFLSVFILVLNSAAYSCAAIIILKYLKLETLKIRKVVYFLLSLAFLNQIYLFLLQGPILFLSGIILPGPQEVNIPAILLAQAIHFLFRAIISYFLIKYILCLKGRKLWVLFAYLLVADRLIGFLLQIIILKFLVGISAFGYYTGNIFLDLLIIFL